MNSHVEDTLPTILSRQYVLVLAMFRPIWFSLFKKNASGTVKPIFSVSSGYLQPSIPQETPHHCPTWCWQEWPHIPNALHDLEIKFWPAVYVLSEEARTHQWDHQKMTEEALYTTRSHRWGAAPPLPGKAACPACTFHTSRALCWVWHLALGVPVAEKLTSGGKSCLTVSNQP